MKKLLKIFLAVMGILSFSCTDMIELEPVSSISGSSFWKTEADATGAAAGMYAILRGQATNNLFLWGEGRSDAMGISVAAPVFQNWDQNVLTADNSGSIFTGASTSWQGMYTLIHHCNLILENVPGIEFAVAAEKDRVLAQAHAMRAYVYYVLARTWGDVPLVTQTISGKMEDLQQARAPVAEVFAQIKADIDKAVALFHDNSFPDNRNMWSLPATYALKADVYLWTGKKMNGGTADIQTALAAAQEVQKADTGLLDDFGSVFEYANKGNREILFAVTRSYEESPEPTIYAWMYILDNFLPTNMDPETRALIEPTGGAPYWAPSDIARQKFNDDDTRKLPTLIEIYTYDENDVATFYSSVVSKFNGPVIAGQRYFIDDYIVYRYADVLLMIAEAKNALGQDPSTEINLVRQRAYGDKYADHTFVNGTKEANDAAILDERFRELMFEGKRWWDLIRFGKAFELVPSLQGREGDTHLLLFPIPTGTLSLNTKLKQNEGYDE